EAGIPEAGKREAVNSSVCADRIEAALLQSQGGRNLQRLGFHDDIRLCSQPDSVSVVPVCLAVSGEGGAVPSLMISGQRR
ncbi:MAG: 2-phosphosulfolactate phosphatase, partial [Planctomycetaceae bacterium]|nr:2-phosphosulfolactate phosphatase [Planctomycetaceae bacterium]